MVELAVKNVREEWIVQEMYRGDTLYKASSFEDAVGHAIDRVRAHGDEMVTIEVRPHQVDEVEAAFGTGAGFGVSL